MNPQLKKRLADLDATEPVTITYLTDVEQAYIDADCDLSIALELASEAATKALDSADATELADATFAFEVATAAARTFAQAQLAIQQENEQ